MQDVQDAALGLYNIFFDIDRQDLGSRDAAVTHAKPRLSADRN